MGKSQFAVGAEEAAAAETREEAANWPPQSIGIIVSQLDETKGQQKIIEDLNNGKVVIEEVKMFEPELER